MSLCWICAEEFPSLQKLKKHVAAAPHSRLCVVCPWCDGKEETFSRIHDLRKHTTKAHPLQYPVLANDFFGEANGFWLSLYPDDYAKLICANEYDCELAEQTRGFVTSWLARAGVSSRSPRDWMCGWGMEKRCNPAKRQRVETDVPYSPSHPYINSSGPTTRLTIPIPSTSGRITPLRELSSFQSYRPSTSPISPNSADMTGLSVLPRPFPVFVPRTTATATSISSPVQPDISSLCVSTTCAVSDVNINSSVFHSSPVSSELPSVFPSVASCGSVETGDDQSFLQSLCASSTVTSVYVRNSVVPYVPTVLPTSASASSVTETSPAEESDISQETISFLQFGGMPLYPPSRREWDVEEVLEIPGTNILWPPKHWRTFTPGQKLNSVEFAAMSCEFVEGVTDISKPELIDKYSFLILPGTPSFNISNSEVPAQRARWHCLKAAGVRSKLDSITIVLSAWFGVPECAETLLQITLYTGLMN